MSKTRRGREVRTLVGRYKPGSGYSHSFRGLRTPFGGYAVTVGINIICKHIHSLHMLPFRGEVKRLKNGERVREKGKVEKRLAQIKQIYSRKKPKYIETTYS